MKIADELRQEYYKIDDLYYRARAEWLRGLFQIASISFDEFSLDSYGHSITFTGVAPTFRFKKEALDYLKPVATEVYLKHTDGWETHYDTTKKLKRKGWRKYQVNVPCGDRAQIASKIWVNYFPASWPKEWLEGYVTVLHGVD